MRKLSVLISTLQIFNKIFLKQAVRLQSQIFGNVENFCVMAHIKTITEFTRPILATSYLSRKFSKKFLKSEKCRLVFQVIKNQKQSHSKNI